jgi:hypothetical protein
MRDPLVRVAAKKESATSSVSSQVAVRFRRLFDGFYKIGFPGEF